MLWETLMFGLTWDAFLVNGFWIQFKPRKNAEIFKNFYPELATILVKKLPIGPNEFNVSTNKDYFTGISNNKRRKFLLRQFP